jgi:hypothetical protein
MRSIKFRPKIFEVQSNTHAATQFFAVQLKGTTQDGRVHVIIFTNKPFHIS